MPSMDGEKLLVLLLSFYPYYVSNKYRTIVIALTDVPYESKGPST